MDDIIVLNENENENKATEDFFQEEEAPYENNEHYENYEHYEHFNRYSRKYITVGDAVMLQCILCVIIIIALAVLNLMKPEMTNDILKTFKQNMDKPFEYKNELNELIKKIAGLIHA